MVSKELLIAQYSTLGILAEAKAQDEKGYGGNRDNKYSLHEQGGGGVETRLSCLFHDEADVG